MRNRRRKVSKRTRQLRRREMFRDRARKGVQILPSLLTLGNLVCGFYAIVHVGAVQWSDGKPQPENSFQVAALAIMIAMIFDMLDGRVARMTKTTSEFGAQLDSLADAITFGVAPGVLVAMLHALGRYDFQLPMWSKLAWLFGAAYACGAVIRLARFNVETASHDEEDHLRFTGLPSPAAAGVIATLVLLHSFLLSDRADARLSWLPQELVEAAGWRLIDLLPFVTLAVGYLMVSKFRYVHAANYFLRGRKSFDYLVAAIFVLPLFALFPEVLLAMIFCGFALSGPVLALRRRVKGHTPVSAPSPMKHAVEPLTGGTPPPPQLSTSEGQDGAAGGGPPQGS